MQKIILKAREKNNEVIMSKVDFDQMVSEIESLEETLEILMDKGILNEIEQSKKKIASGNVITIQSKEDLDRLFE